MQLAQMSHIEEIRPQSDTRGVFIERRRLETDTHGDRVKTEAEVGAGLLQAKACQSLPIAVSHKLRPPACLSFRQLQTVTTSRG